MPEKKKRRKFTAAYKLRMLQRGRTVHSVRRNRRPAAPRGAVFLSSDHMAPATRKRASLQGLNPKKRGRKAKPQDPSAERIAQLEKENQRLKNRLRKAEIIIEAQKKISEILGIDQNLEDSSKAANDSSRRYIELR